MNRPPLSALVESQLRYWLAQLYECENPRRAHCILAMCRVLSFPEENDYPFIPSQSCIPETDALQSLTMPS